MSGRPGGWTPVLALLLVAGGCRCRAPGQPAPRDLGEAPEAPASVVTDTAGLTLTHLSRCAHWRKADTVHLAARQSGGRVVYLRLERGADLVEEVTAGALPAAPDLDLDPDGAPVIAVLTAPVVGEHARIPPPATAPRMAVPGEGALRLLRRRGPGLWRGEVLADRALSPQVAVASDGSVHLAFLQPWAPGRFVVVHAIVQGASVGRESLGQTSARALALVLAGDRPVVAFVDLQGRLGLYQGDGRKNAMTPVDSATMPHARALALAARDANTVDALVVDPDTGDDDVAYLRLQRWALGASPRLMRVRLLGRLPVSGNLTIDLDATETWSVGGETGTLLGSPAGVRRLPGLRAPRLAQRFSYRVVGLDPSGHLRQG